MKGSGHLLPFDHFDLVAPYYDRLLGRREASPLFDLVAPQPGHGLLDVGGGTGRIAQRFVGRAARVCILDPSPRMLQEGRRKGICIVQGTAEQTPFQAEAFDRILMVDAFHHLIDQQRAAGEMMRILSPGGRLIVEEPDIAWWGVRLVAWGEKLLLMRSHFYRAAEVGRMFDRVGGRVQIERQGYTFWVIVDKLGES